MSVYRIVIEVDTGEIEFEGRQPWASRTEAERLAIVRADAERIYWPLPRLIAERRLVSVEDITP